MVDRRLFGDLALAILVALPLAWLARPQAAAAHSRTPALALSTASADRAPGGRLGLLS